MPLLYIHVPFCQSKCSYCAFYSEPIGGKCVGGTYESETSSVKVREYLEAIEIEAYLRRQDAPQGVSSLFIGGGTPTALEENELRWLLKNVDKTFAFHSPDVEKTVEGNPGTLDRGKLRVLHEYGINRISLGVQTFADPLLKEIGRIHTEAEIHESINMIRQAGFSNLNLDLMFGLPGQNLDSWKESLDKALIYRPEHLSLYALMLEEGTPLAKRYSPNPNPGPSPSPLRGSTQGCLPDEDVQAQMYEFAVSLLKGAGYVHYETSNFALPGYECRHNRGYWLGEDYIGLGPGAVSCIRGRRWHNIEDTNRYLSMLRKHQEPLDEKEILSEKDRMTERIMLGLRMFRGLNLTEFQEEFGVVFVDIYGRIMEPYLSQGILELEGEYLRLNPQYAFVANSVIVDFV